MHPRRLALMFGAGAVRRTLNSKSSHWRSAEEEVLKVKVRQHIPNRTLISIDFSSIKAATVSISVASTLNVYRPNAGLWHSNAERLVLVISQEVKKYKQR